MSKGLDRQKLSQPYKYIIDVPTEELRSIKYVSAFPVFFNVTFIYFSISAEDKHCHI